MTDEVIGTAQSNNSEQAADRIIAWIEAEKRRFSIDRETMELVEVEMLEDPRTDDWMWAVMDQAAWRRIKSATGIQEVFSFAKRRR